MAEMEVIQNGDYGIAINCVDASNANELSLGHSSFNILPVLRNKEDMAAPIGSATWGDVNECYINTGVLPILGYKRSGDFDCWGLVLSSNENTVENVPFSIVYNENGPVNSNEKVSINIAGFFKRYNEFKKITNLAIKFPIKKPDKSGYAYAIITMYNGAWNQKVVDSATEFKARFLASKGLRIQSEPDFS